MVIENKHESIITKFFQSIFKKKIKNEENEDIKNTFEETSRSKLYKFIYAHSKGDSDEIAKCYTTLYEKYKEMHKINLPKLAKAYGHNIKTIEYAELIDKKTKTTHLIDLSVLAFKLFGNQASELYLRFYTPNEKEQICDM